MLDASAPTGRTAHPRDGTVTAVLGPTNTGKTHYAIERMLAHRTGVMGLPLRLLAREVYDKIVALRGPSVVALVTGEEKIAPPRAQYWVCTVEAMPTEIGADFVAVDEIQLCADPERGHVFTDRLLNARGLHETLFLGSDSMRGAISALIPRAKFLRRERFSKLTYTGGKKLSRMPARSAVVSFSVDSVYAIAELMRRQKGGVAVVMGALSPRTRNAQVELYQNGDVEHLVATDAIGMGLNLDVNHVFFSATRKFDGRGFRELRPHELAQIAGRAGRYKSDGAFGVTGEAEALDAEIIEAIEDHRFAPVRRLMWRNSRLAFGSVDGLIASLEAAPTEPGLMKAREADDLQTLKALAEDEEIRDMAREGPAVRRLWEVCQIPDFRKVSEREHAALVSRIYRFLRSERGVIPSDWMAGRIRMVDRTDGDIDALSKRLAFIRTWTYVAQRRDWVEAPEEWRGAAREVEDRLSDALHAALTKRFVDRRTSVLMRRLKQKERLVAEVNEQGEVTVEGHVLGRLDGFRFTPDPSAEGDELKTLRAASTQALQAEFSRRADRFYNAPDTEMDVTEQGGLMWGELAVGRLAKGADHLTPSVVPFVDEMAGDDARQKVERRLTHWINRRVAALFEPLVKMRDDETMTGLARGIAFQLVESLGVIPRPQIAKDVKELDQDGRALLRKHGVRFGQHTIFMPALLKPAPTRLRLVLWGLWDELDDIPSPPPPGLVTIPTQPSPSGFWPRAGYRLAGERAIRIDMLERLADMIRNQDQRGGFEATADMLSITGCTLEQFADLMQGLGYKAEKGERPKPAAVPETKPSAAPAAEEAAASTDAPAADDAPAAEPGDAPVAEAPAAEAAPEAPAEAPAETAEAPAAEAPAEAGTPVEAAPEAAPAAEATSAEPEAAPEAEAAEAPAAEETPAEAPAEGEVELQTYYVFTWAPRPRGGGANRGPRRQGGGDRQGQGQGQGERQGGGPRQARGDGDGPKGGGRGKGGGGRGRDGDDKPRGKGPHKGKGKGGPREERPREFQASPPRDRRRNEVDPDNPFAALMALKNRDG
ncbi:DEAD/DEAH box helicase [Albimonas pacifica]|uniref:ATP-dependent RNA helicase SUPV3L1/SUV3 n=1 Tax=Albimonas pacifica TaxID=1114924 RepID=A0A1I3IPY8_9RHOB|nr:DEAD/DEAH box helicase [Albimonas pacifica]SFI49937.1 ATP-dependent RNA helicase SUPV3L1/SUV3 [Albimonas pacifica]